MPAFSLVQETEVPELNTQVRLYRHEKSGAQVMSLINDDENKSFGIAFRTIPEDSTGVAHILEHAVLNGSRKFPVKEPFVELIKGSLNTFLNAMTASDKTMYPVASTNLKDFYNLVDVYMDAVFFPLIQSHILEQEGWHYELEAADQPLEYKGVVFNEMKGAYSSPENRLGDYIQQTLFPDVPYRLDSGGDPREIPNLTYEQFKAFHSKYYHPSNALIFFYGDDDPEERLRFLDGYLKEFDAATIDAAVPLQPFFDEPRRFTFSYPSSEEEEGLNKSMLTVNWVLPEMENLEEVFAGDILSDILLGNQAAPLRKALIDSGLGEKIIGGGLSNYTRQPTFSVGLKGIESTNSPAVEALIVETLTELAEQGIDRETIEASLNSIEFSLRENNTGSFPRGLVLFFIALDFWSYGRDPIEPLFFEGPMKAIRDRFEAGEPLFENLIRRLLLENWHRTTVLMEPDPEMGAKEEAEERQKLDAIKAAWTPEQIEAVITRTQQLREIQETPDTPEALATLPTLSLDDLEKKTTIVPKEVLTIADTTVLHHDLFTNGIVYLELAFDLHSLPQELLPYLPMFTRCLLGMGTETEDFVKLTRRIGRKIGGLYATSFVSPAAGTDEAVTKLFLRGKSTMAQARDLLEILRDVVLTVKLDNSERFRQMVLESKSAKESSLVPSGHSYANARLRAHFNEAYWLNEQISGLSSLFFIRKLAVEVENDWDGVLAKLEQIRRIVINRNAAMLNITLDKENWDVLQPELQAFLHQLPSEDYISQTWERKPYARNEGFTIPAQVNYVAKGGSLFDNGYQPHGSAFVVNKYLYTTYIWEKIRVQGGAYGGMVAWDRISGVYSYISYRDPNLGATIHNYDGTPAFIRNLDLSQEELTKSIIGTIGDVDGYQLPDARGHGSFVRHMTGVTDEDRQNLRDEILGTTTADFKAFGEALQALRDSGEVVVLGGAEDIRLANEEMGGDWLTVEKAL